MLKFMIWKEFLQLRRDRKMFFILFLAPLLQLIVLGFAANFDVTEIKTAVYDSDNTIESRNYLSHYFSGGYFKRTENLKNMKQIDKLLESGKAETAIVIKKGFQKNILSGKSGEVEIIINGSDINSATQTLSYASRITANYNIAKIKAMHRDANNLPGITLNQRILYNQQLKTRNFMVPAIMGLILMIITTMLTSMAIVREKEIGTIEQLIVTPIDKKRILAGKIVPFMLIGFIDVIVISTAAVLLFKVPLKGDLFLLALSAGLFLFNTLGLGLFVSTVSSTQQQAMMAVIFFIIMPFIYLSGFVFPIDNMPETFQYIANVIPLTHFLILVRGIFLKGSTFSEVWINLLALFITGFVIFVTSVKRFKKSV